MVDGNVTTVIISSTAAVIIATIPYIKSRKTQAKTDAIAERTTNIEEFKNIVVANNEFITNLHKDNAILREENREFRKDLKIQEKRIHELADELNKCNQRASTAIEGLENRVEQLE